MWSDVELSTSLSVQHGYMYCEHVKLSTLSEQLKGSGEPQPSPVFVYSKKQIQENVAAYKDPLMLYNIPHLLGYAIKANHNPKLLCILREAGCGAVTVSGAEIQLALRCGFPASDIVFNGTGKQAEELELAVSQGCLINVDSAFDLQAIISTASRLGSPARVMIRINPNIDPEVHPFLATGAGISKFGVDESQLPDLLDTIQASAGHVTLVGLHIHLGSTIDRVQLFSEALDLMLSLTQEVSGRGFRDLLYLNLGGGLGIDYYKHSHRTSSTSDHSTARPQALPSATDLIIKVKDKLMASGLTLILEPGRSLIGNAGTLLTKVIGVKKNAGKNYIVVDGSMTELIRPALYSAYHHIELAQPITTNQTACQSPSHGSNHPANQTASQSPSHDSNYPANQTASQSPSHDSNYPANHTDSQSPSHGSKHPASQANNHLTNQIGKQLYDVVGPVCECADFLGKDRLLATPHVGCLLAVLDAGAYCSSMSSNYNIRLRPCEVLVDGGSWTLIRRADILDDVMAPYNV